MEASTFFLCWYSLGWAVAATWARDEGVLKLNHFIASFVMVPLVLFIAVPAMLVIAVFSDEHSPVIYRKSKRSKADQPGGGQS